MIPSSATTPSTRRCSRSPNVVTIVAMALFARARQPAAARLPVHPRAQSFWSRRRPRGRGARVRDVPDPSRERSTSSCVEPARSTGST
jgi:hypothetical protein